MVLALCTWSERSVVRTALDGGCGEIAVLGAASGCRLSWRQRTSRARDVGERTDGMKEVMRADGDEQALEFFAAKSQFQPEKKALAEPNFRETKNLTFQRSQRQSKEASQIGHITCIIGPCKCIGDPKLLLLAWLVGDRVGQCLSTALTFSQKAWPTEDAQTASSVSAPHAQLECHFPTPFTSCSVSHRRRPPTSNLAACSMLTRASTTRPSSGHHSIPNRRPPPPPRSPPCRAHPTTLPNHLLPRWPSLSGRIRLQSDQHRRPHFHRCPWIQLLCRRWPKKIPDKTHRCLLGHEHLQPHPRDRLYYDGTGLLMLARRCRGPRWRRLISSTSTECYYALICWRRGWRT